VEGVWAPEEEVPCPSRYLVKSNLQKWSATIFSCPGTDSRCSLQTLVGTNALFLRPQSFRYQVAGYPVASGNVASEPAMPQIQK
jgi:hypothetical protein